MKLFLQFLLLDLLLVLDTLSGKSLFSITDFLLLLSDGFFVSLSLLLDKSSLLGLSCSLSPLLLGLKFFQSFLLSKLGPFSLKNQSFLFGKFSSLGLKLTFSFLSSLSLLTSNLIGLDARL